MVAVADALARAGDPELYEFETTEGALGSEGAHWTGVPKSLRTLVMDMARYVSGDFKRYAAPKPGNPADLISPSAGGSDRLTDLANVPANQYFEEDFLRDVYLREVGAAFPDRETKSKSSAVRGDTGTVPGVLFMFGATEHLVSPYPEGTESGLMTADQQVSSDSGTTSDTTTDTSTSRAAATEEPPARAKEPAGSSKEGHSHSKKG